MSNRQAPRRRNVASASANDESPMSQDEDDGIVEATPAASGNSRAQKRARQSLARDSTNASDNKRARADRTQPHSDDDEDAAPSQQLWSQPSSAAGSTQVPATLSSSFDLCRRSGKVARIVLKNFMCHSHLAVDLNNRINLMIGHNGSGKSAILTALVIGMGSKASATSRSSSLTQLIKRGENNATIEIHLENHPQDGYEVAKYGERIIVQRALFSTGRSVYKMKSASGTVVSTKRDDLLKMMMFLNIQVDNPVCVLNQDASRSFLRDSDPKKRYLLFLKATQIETILEKLHGCTVHVRNAKLHLRSLQQRAITYQQTVSDLTDRLAHLRSVGDLRKHVRSLRCQQSWKQAIVQEQLTAEIAAALAEFQQQYDVLLEASGSKTAMEDRIRNEMRECLRMRDESLAAMADDQAAHDTMRAALREKRQVHEAMQRTLRKLEMQRDRMNRDVAQLQSDLAERLAQTDEMSRVQRERAENDAKLVQLRRQVEETGAMLESAKRDADMTINTKTETMNGQHELKRERQEYRNQCDRLKRDIAQCDSAAKDSLLIYGDYMTRMVAAIEAAHKRGQFTKLPLGPLGRYVQLEDDRWKLPIENLMGGHVQSFIVNDAADRRVLSELIRKQFPQHARHSIISTRFVDKVYDVRAGATRAPQGSRLAMDVIRVSNPVVMNCLIDQCKIETILLTEDERVAMRLTSDEENVPEHLQRIVLLQPFSVFYPEPNYRSYSIDQRHAKYLQVDVAQRRQHLDQELRNVTSKMNAVERTLAQQEARVESITQTLSVMSKDRQKLELALRNQRLNIADLEKIEYPEENDAEYFRKELADLQAAQNETVVALEAESKRVAEHAKLMEAKDIEMAALKKTVQEKSAVGRDFQLQHDEAKQRLDNNAVNAQYNEAKCRAMDGDMQKLRVELADAETKVARLQATAAKLGERIVTKYSDEELQRKLNVKERRIVAIESTEEPLDLVERRLANGKDALDHMERLITTLAETMNMLSAARKKRFETLKHLKENMSLRVRHTFNSLLKLRNYSGQIVIDDKAQELQLSVVPRDKHIENAVSNAKSLSGGERSYSTIAFLLSLWSCVNFPFYFLDEYDVFTDQVNRHYITKLLLNEAEKKPTRQYTFLTPQDMSNVLATDDLTIHRLAEPDR